MQIETVTLFLLIYVVFYINHGAMHLEKKQNPLIRICLKNFKVPFKLLGKRKIGRGKKFRSLKNQKEKIYLFLSNNEKKIPRNKKRSKMSMLVENEQKKHCSEKKEYDFKGISKCLNANYWKDRIDDPPPLIQIAPMINVTNRHFRALMRMLTNKAQLWTEMVVDNTLLYNINSLEQYLGYDETEHPIVCQLGGSDCSRMAEAAVLVEQYGYDEININLGCPSNKVANRGAFGAYLMKNSEHVRNLVYEVKKRVQIPVSVKIRTGVDDLDSFDFLQNFIQLVSSAGCNNFIVHARKAWLKGLDPKKNRKIPPLEYKKVYDLCQIYPHLKFTLNGGVETIEEAVVLLNGYIPLSHAHTHAQEQTQKQSNISTQHCNKNSSSNIIKTKEKEKKNIEEKNRNKIEGLQYEKEEKKPKVNSNRTYIKIQNYDINPLNGVMIGRAAMENTVVLSQIDKLVYNEKVPSTAYSRRSLLEAYIIYLEKQTGSCSVVSAFELLKPILGILKGMPGHRTFRYKLDYYIRAYANTLSCSEILEKVIHDVNLAAPGVLDLPLSDRRLQEEYINNF